MSELSELSDVNSNGGDHRHHLLLDTTSGITLEEPNLAQMRQERQDRTRATMQVWFSSIHDQHIKITPNLQVLCRETKGISTKLASLVIATFCKKSKTNAICCTHQKV